ncbi:hypothetical protein HRbin36_00902 [bacterium HR36]|nr:hypothetical protein HRbin36_00902 [bacterium HR36]
MNCEHCRYCRDGWYEALEKIGLRGKVLAEIFSAPNNDELLPDNRASPPVWKMSKLDRSLVRELTPAVTHLASFLHILTTQVNKTSQHAYSESEDSASL